MQGKNPQFQIGLALAGAISAGAYSAGVIDFLCEAFRKWDSKKEDDQANTPGHDVCIKVISGASAGAITGAISVVSLAKGMGSYSVPDKPQYRYTLSPVYDAWVVDPDLASTTGNVDLLGLNDIGSKPLLSVLNSACLDSIAKKALEAKQAPANRTEYSWIGDSLHLFFMVTNLRGVPYEVRFQAGASQGAGHVMMNHGDRVHFSVNGLGNGGPSNNWCGADNPMQVKVQHLEDPAGSGNNLAEVMVNAALASGAFPIGLAARNIFEDKQNLALRQWPSLDPNTRLTPAFPPAFTQNNLGYVAPDGGLINNEPFEYAHAGIRADGAQRNERDPDKADRAVIMIDPFPEAPYFELDEAIATDRSLTKIPSALITALKNQARFKPDEIAIALHEDVRSRYLIAPTRSDQEKDLTSRPLATALLGGFGGFLDRSFREHDYQLGRRNCQRFLQEHFAVGLKNAIALNNPGVQQYDAAKANVRIVPLFETTADPIPLPEWPRISLDRLQQIEDRIRARAGAVLSSLLKEKIGSSLLRTIVQTVWSCGLSGRLVDAIHWRLLSELIRCDQLKEFEKVGAFPRAVAVALCDQKYDYCRETSLERLGNGAALTAAIDAIRARAPSLEIWRGDISGEGCYCWAARRPGAFARAVPGYLGKPVLGWDKIAPSAS